MAFNAAQTIAVLASPIAGTSQNVTSSTPSTAPAVFAAYSPAIDRRPAPPTRRSIAGSVAPIAAVAGNSSTKLAPKLTDHCHSAVGSAPIHRCTRSPAGRISRTSASPHTPIAASQIRYQGRGVEDRSIRPPSSNAPSASPPKNAVTTASTAAASKPNQSAHCCVHTIW